MDYLHKYRSRAEGAARGGGCRAAARRARRPAGGTPPCRARRTRRKCRRTAAELQREPCDRYW